MRLLFLAPLLLCSCAATILSHQMLWPSARAMWPPIRGEAESGIEAARATQDLSAEEAEAAWAAVLAMDEGLMAGNVAEVDWDLIMPWAVRGIRLKILNGLISETGATILYQRLINFQNILDVLAGRRKRLSSGTGATKIYIRDYGYYYPHGITPLSMEPHHTDNNPRRELGLPLLGKDASCGDPFCIWCEEL